MKKRLGDNIEHTKTQRPLSSLCPSTPRLQKSTQAKVVDGEFAKRATFPKGSPRYHPQCLRPKQRSEQSRTLNFWWKGDRKRKTLDFKDTVLFPLFLSSCTRLRAQKQDAEVLRAIDFIGVSRARAMDASRPFSLW